MAPTQCVKCSPLVLPPSRGAEMQHELIFSVGVVIQKGRSAGAGLWAERQCKTTCPPPPRGRRFNISVSVVYIRFKKR